MQSVETTTEYKTNEEMQRNKTICERHLQNIGKIHKSKQELV
jgi:hypothetical protein